MKKMNFSDIPAHCKYTAKHKATISTWHSNIIEWAVSHFDGTDGAKRKLIAAMNYITSCVVSCDSIPDVPIQRIRSSLCSCRRVTTRNMGIRMP